MIWCFSMAWHWFGMFFISYYFIEVLKSVEFTLLKVRSLNKCVHVCQVCKCHHRTETDKNCQALTTFSQKCKSHRLTHFAFCHNCSSYLSLFLWQLNIPEWVVNLRHDFTHNKLPSLKWCRKGERICIQLLHYTHRQISDIICN